ncbi:MAG TPA: phosphatidylglycerol lysyltransferase domain-containing protein, partial [Planctomycetota bacterium]|nr:phosphatidylglycerol lysyltransferase domain-containing protein [Planctomycetota bacterium]
ILAFSNLWQTADRSELSVDLMRFLPDRHPGVMEFLFTQIMLWGKEQGFARFNLGMAPLAGVDPHRLGPLWNQISSLIYRRGEHFYNFQGLRNYKDKFDPEWHPRYIASPGGLATPQIMANVTSLISGGILRLLRK